MRAKITAQKNALLDASLENGRPLFGPLRAFLALLRCRQESPVEVPIHRGVYCSRSDFGAQAAASLELPQRVPPTPTLPRADLRHGCSCTGPTARPSSAPKNGSSPGAGPFPPNSRPASTGARVRHRDELRVASGFQKMSQKMHCFVHL